MSTYYLKHVLLPGEKVIATGGSHPAVYFPGLGWTLLALVCGYTKYFLNTYFEPGYTVLSFAGFHLAVQHVETILYVVASCCFVYGIVRIAGAFNEYACAEYAVTDQRIIVKEGIVRRTIEEMDSGFLIKIIVKQSVMGKIFNYGDVVVYDHSGQHIDMPTTANPYDLKKQVASTLPRDHSHGH